MAEKNIAALLDPTAYTVHVNYQQQDHDTNYTYITNIPGIQVDDFIVVPTIVRRTSGIEKAFKSKAPAFRDSLDTSISGSSDVFEEVIPGAEAANAMIEAINNRYYRLSVARVVGVDKEVEIPPDDTIEYAWVVQKIDMLPYGNTLSRNKEITDAVKDAYKRNLRKSFAERILGEVSDDVRDRLVKLLGK